MSNHIVVRRGAGKLHIAEASFNHYDAICGAKITAPAGTKIHTWSAGRAATAVWNAWSRCPKCETRDRELRRK